MFAGMFGEGVVKRKGSHGMCLVFPRTFLLALKRSERSKRSEKECDERVCKVTRLTLLGTSFVAELQRDNPMKTKCLV